MKSNESVIVIFYQAGKPEKKYIIPRNVVLRQEEFIVLIVEKEYDLFFKFPTNKLASNFILAFGEAILNFDNDEYDNLKVNLDHYLGTFSEGIE